MEKSNSEFKSYTFTNTRKLGISDLECEYAFYGNSQGDDSRTSSVEDYLSSGGWKSVSSNFKDINYLDQNEVDKRVLEIRNKNKHRIISLKEQGEYGKEVDSDITLTLKQCPTFDTSFLNIITTSSCRMRLLNFNNGE